jgi:hypothetical protein
MAVAADHLWALAFSRSLLRVNIRKHSREKIARRVIPAHSAAAAQRHPAIVGRQPPLTHLPRAATFAGHSARQAPDLQVNIHHILGPAGNGKVSVALKVVFVHSVLSIIR